MKRFVLFFTLLHTLSAAAAERPAVDPLRTTTLNLIRLLVEEGVLSRDKAEQLIRQAEQAVEAVPAAPASAADKDAKTVRVPYVPEVVKREIRDQIKQEVLAQAKSERWGDVGALPSWLDRITIEGDLRLRMQYDRFQDSNTPALVYQTITGTSIANTTEDRERARLRARFGLYAKATDWIGAGIRLTTGAADPVSTNQTLGTTFNKNSVFLDRAYVRLDPAEWFTLAAGRIPNPWFGTDLVWNENLAFEGAAATFKPRLRDDLTAFFTVGAFPLEEIESSATTRAGDKWLYGVQGGLEFTTPNNSRMKFGVALYDFKRTEGIPNPSLGSQVNDRTAPQFRQKGNTLFNIDNDGDPTTNLFGLASQFRNLNLTGSIDVARWDPVRVVLTGDYVKNIGFDRDEIRQRTGIDLAPRTKGYQARLMVGMPQLRDRGDWQAFVAYKYLQRDAVMDAFTDSDFRLGGTDAKGYVLGGAWGIDRNAWLALRWSSANAIDGPPLSIDVLQLDFNVRF